ncbi:MAG: hypothetical protein MUD14_27060 [Hydrococcus sp. Prado102]|nr:hypothetical protein [Hydrococcus sp. Prado102]
MYAWQWKFSSIFAQDEPEHLRTIRDRILKDELKARDELIYSLVNRGENIFLREEKSDWDKCLSFLSTKSDRNS